MSFYEFNQRELIQINGGGLLDDIIRVGAATVGTVLVATAPLAGFAAGVGGSVVATPLVGVGAGIGAAATFAGAGAACLDYASNN